MSGLPGNKFSFARGEVVAPVGFWERGSEASGFIPPSGRSFTPPPPAPVSASAPDQSRAPKTAATSPSGETHSLPLSVAQGMGNALPLPKQNTKADDFGWKAGPKEISCKEINESLIGREVARDTYLDGRIRERQLREQSEAIIERLERMGIQGRLTRGDTAVVGLVSGQAELATDYRNCNLIPYQQSRNVHTMLKNVRYLVDTTKAKRMRMLVVSAGWCRLESYREHHKAHTRRMSKFAAHPKLKDFGIEVQFYNVENTIHRADDGAAMMNLHSHVLFRSNRYLGKQKWTEFLDFAKGYFPKGYVHDSKIQKANEVVKYCFKPAEFDLLSDDEFAELFHQVSGGRPKFDPETGEVETRKGENGELIAVHEGPLKFFHPLGALREFRSTLHKNRQNLIQVPTVDGRWIWRLTERKERQPRPESEAGERPNVVLAITRPMPKFTRRMEPCVIVHDYTGNFEEMVTANGLEGVVSEAKSIFAKREAEEKKAAQKANTDSQGASPSMQHTTTTTVPERNAPSWGQDWSPPPQNPHGHAGGRLQ
ncbi:hypothetical protein [Magnetovibrio sp.]|uniref:hypothetical protein n=1 Tax=Magnetovibrio sp. TaxID=2024836 RepID=UPI002F92C70F